MLPAEPGRVFMGVSEKGTLAGLLLVLFVVGLMLEVMLVLLVMLLLVEWSEEELGLGVSRLKLGLVGEKLNAWVKWFDRKTLWGVPERGRWLSVGLCNVKIFSEQDRDATFFGNEVCEISDDSSFDATKITFGIQICILILLFYNDIFKHCNKPVLIFRIGLAELKFKFKADCLAIAFGSEILVRVLSSNDSALNLASKSSILLCKEAAIFCSEIVTDNNQNKFYLNKINL